MIIVIYFKLIFVVLDIIYLDPEAYYIYKTKLTTDEPGCKSECLCDNIIVFKCEVWRMLKTL